MIAIGSQSSSNSPLSQVNATSKKAIDEAVEAATTDKGVPAEGVQVSLSGLGIQKSVSGGSANSNSDIEESGLPDGVQRILKMIRELKQKIAEAQQEMRAMMADRNMDPQVRKARVAVLQTTLSTLTANLLLSNHSLDKLSRDGALSPEQALQATKLALK